MNETSLLRPVLAALLALAACAPEDGPSMKPGSDCGECHGGGGGADGEDGPPWTVSGTVYASASGTGDGVRGAGIHVADANGKVVTLHSQAVGNFYLADGLAFPLTVSVERSGVTRTMQAKVQPGQGSCNHCHHVGGTASDSFGPVPGALFAP